MRRARTSAKAPYFLLLQNMATEAANEAELCPDGKEKSVGLSVISFMPSARSKGRVLAINGFNVIFVTTRLKINAKQIAVPILLVFLKNNSVTPVNIQIQPASPKKVINFITESSNGQERYSLIKSSIANSKFISEINALANRHSTLFKRNGARSAYLKDSEITHKVDKIVYPSAVVGKTQHY